MSGCRSHTREAIDAARKAGRTIWLLDTGSDGLDDTLIADPGDGESELRNELEHWLGREIPAHWRLARE